MVRGTKVVPPRGLFREAAVRDTPRAGPGCAGDRAGTVVDVFLDSKVESDRIPRRCRHGGAIRRREGGVFHGTLAVHVGIAHDVPFLRIESADADLVGSGLRVGLVNLDVNAAGVICEELELAHHEGLGDVHVKVLAVGDHGRRAMAEQ